MTPNKTLVFTKIPTEMPVVGEHLKVEDRPIDLDAPAPKDGMLLEVLYAAYDPYLRPKMRDPKQKSYSPAFLVGDPIANSCISKVLKSNSPDFKEGDLVRGLNAIAQYATVENPKAGFFRKINNPGNLDLAEFLGSLGMPGLTAWTGLHKIGQPKKGETIFVSSAAGAVGQIVGQIAKREGLTVIGSVGSDEKLEFITKECGFDAGFNYKKESPWDALPRLAPNGIDIYWENVGGDHLEASLHNFNRLGRIVACGSISQYNTPFDQRTGIRNIFEITGKSLTMSGFIVGQPEFGPVYAAEHLTKMSEWIADGSIKTKTYVTEGIDNAAEGFVGMLEGKNFGRAVLKVK